VNFFEGPTPAPGLSNTTAALRANGGCTDTDNNGSDFAAGAPAPPNSGSPAHFCNSPTRVGSAPPAATTPGRPSPPPVTRTPGTPPPSTSLAVVCDLSAIGGSPAQTLFDDGSNGDATPGDNVFSFSTTVTASPGAKSLPCSVSDAEGRSSLTTIAFTVE